jgi:hypothetical protein
MRVNENIADILNLRPLDEVLKENGVDVTTETPEIDADTQHAVSTLRELSAKLTLIEGTDHAEAMDDLHGEILQHARDMMAYGFNIDHPRARGIFEIAATLYGHAISTKNAKRDAQLKSMKLAMEKKRIELEEKRTNHVIGANAAIESDTTILVEDRNELLRRIRQQMPDK